MLKNENDALKLFLAKFLNKEYVKLRYLQLE